MFVYAIPRVGGIMKKVIYLILGIASLAYLLCVAYAILQTNFTFMPAIDFLTPLAGLTFGFSSITEIIYELPIVITAIFAFTYFFSRDIKILFLIFTIIAIAVIVLKFIGVLA